MLILLKMLTFSHFHHRRPSAPKVGTDRRAVRRFPGVRQHLVKPASPAAMVNLVIMLSRADANRVERDRLPQAARRGPAEAGIKQPAERCPQGDDEGGEEEAKNALFSLPSPRQPLPPSFPWLMPLLAKKLLAS